MDLCRGLAMALIGGCSKLENQIGVAAHTLVVLRSLFHGNTCQLSRAAAAAMRGAGCGRVEHGVPAGRGTQEPAGAPGLTLATPIRLRS